jgi:hypothetical protein
MSSAGRRNRQHETAAGRLSSEDGIALVTALVLTTVLSIVGIVGRQGGAHQVRLNSLPPGAPAITTTTPATLQWVAGSYVGG